MLIRYVIMKLQLNRYFACLLFGLLCLLACTEMDKDGDTYIPDLVSNMAMVSVNTEGLVTTLALDDGSIYDVRSQKLTTESCDTVVRCMVTYVPNESKAQVYSLGNVFCTQPLPASAFSLIADGSNIDLPRDPMKVVSVWRSGGYVNLHLGVLTTGKGMHKYAFCEDSLGHYSLLHLRPADDAESYTMHVYFSMPVPEGVDSLSFSVYTYDGIYTRTL